MYKSNINFNLYKTFYDVAMCKSILEASKKTYISQPAITKSIKKLESELDTKLFYRHSTGMELTDKGKELLFFVNEAFNSLSNAERVLLEDNKLKRGKISIGVPSQIAAFYIFDNISKFHLKYPNIEITIISKSTSQLLDLLETHEIDFIIDTSPIKTKYSNCVIKPLVSINNCFAVKNESKSVAYRNIDSIKKLNKVPLILPIPGTNNRSELDKVFEENKVEINNVINIHTSEMIIGAIRKDMGIGYLIEDTISKELESKEFIKLNIKEQLPKVTINLVYVKNYLTTAPLAFIKEYIDKNLKL